MAIKPNLAPRSRLSVRKKIVLIIVIIGVLLAYYFISYFFCFFLIKNGFISAFNDGFPNPPPTPVVASVPSPAGIDSGVAAPPPPIRPPDWNTNFNITNPSPPPPPPAISSPVISPLIASSPITPPPSPSPIPQPDLAPNITDPTLFFGSHFDSFANNKYVDSGQTTLYYDETAAAYFFPPDYVFEEAGAGPDSGNQDILNGVSLNVFEGPYGDKRCLASHCLEQKGNNLFFDNQKLILPDGLADRNIAAVSIGSLTKRWLVGVTVKNENNYEGLVYNFDGNKFSRLLTPAPIISPHFGILGFGGGENNFLIIYGAYKGIAYHFQGDKVADVSRFFDIRVMNGGFKAEVLFTAFESNVNWYVYSSTLYHPVLIKLWQNQGTEIAGEMVFNDLFQRYDESGVFKLSRAESSAITLLAKLRKDNHDYWFYLSDRGFRNENGGRLVSAPIAHDGYISLIKIVKVAQSRLDVDSSSAGYVDFSFSVDGKNWQKLENSKNIDVAVPATQYFFLKAVFPKFEDKFYSPYLSELLFNYYCRKQ